MNMLNSMETEAQQQAQQQQQFQQELLNEKMAINAIQKSLMLCESAVKGTPYSTQVHIFLFFLFSQLLYSITIIKISV